MTGCREQMDRDLRYRVLTEECSHRHDVHLRNQASLSHAPPPLPPPPHAADDRSLMTVQEAHNHLRNNIAVPTHCCLPDDWGAQRCQCPGSATTHRADVTRLCQDGVADHAMGAAVQTYMMSSPYWDDMVKTEYDDRPTSTIDIDVNQQHPCSGWSLLLATSVIDIDVARSITVSQDRSLPTTNSAMDVLQRPEEWP